MNAEALLTHYARIAEAPDAIARLRRFVLDLAVRGKLVPQDPGEGSATRIMRATLPPDAGPHALPASWAWVRIGEQLELLNGMPFKPTDWTTSGLRIVRIQNLNNPSAPFNHCRPEFARERSLIDDGAFLISWSGTPGTSFGAFIWDRGPAVLNQHIFRCEFKTDAFIARYLQIAINGRLDEMIEKAHGGVGLQHITKGKLEALLIALPPLSEQHRIVAKLSELMALCDRLEAARTAREATRDRLAAASLARLNTPNPDTFPADARFALDALPALTSRPDQIKQFRQTILNLAVRGKLVPQDAGDEPATKLLRRLRGAQLSALAAEGIRARQAVQALQREELWFDIPPTWELTHFDEVFVIVSGVTKGQRIPANEAVEAPYLRVANVQRGFLDLAVMKTLTVRAADVERYALRADDLLMTEGGDWDKLGRTAVWRNEVAGCIHQNHVFRVRPPSKDIASEWVATYTNSSLGRTFFEDASKQTTNLASINMTQLRGCPLPLPPLAEQRRIVAKVDELMALCDQLEASLVTANSTRAKLLEATLREALLPAKETLLEAAQ